MSRAAESGIDAIAVTPSDTDVINTSADRPVRAIWVGGAGNIVADTYEGNTVTLVGCLAGSLIPLSVKKIYNTNTTATSLVVFY